MRTRAFRVLAATAATAVALFASGCASYVPFTAELETEHHLAAKDLQNLQFYTSDRITLRRELKNDASQVTGTHKLLVIAGKRIEEVVIEKHTPGVIVGVGAGTLKVSFEEGSALEFRFAARHRPALDQPVELQHFAEGPNPFPGEQAAVQEPTRRARPERGDYFLLPRWRALGRVPRASLRGCRRQLARPPRHRERVASRRRAALDRSQGSAPLIASDRGTPCPDARAAAANRRAHPPRGGRHVRDPRSSPRHARRRTAERRDRAPARHLHPARPAASPLRPSRRRACADRGCPRSQTRAMLVESFRDSLDEALASQARPQAADLLFTPSPRARRGRKPAPTMPSSSMPRPKSRGGSAAAADPRGAARRCSRHSARSGHSAANVVASATSVANGACGRWHSALPRDGKPPRGGTSPTTSGFGRDIPYVARSFGTIYVLVLTFDEPSGRASAPNAHRNAHMSSIERLVLAPPPLDPSPSGGARAVRAAHVGKLWSAFHMACHVNQK